ncbi:MAG: integrase core domain-containing protein [Cocleimonas sp.]
MNHQTIDKHCPWQNGRIERFFGTLKSTLANQANINKSDFPYLMYSFEFWYNNIRPHQNLENKTPESVYLARIKKWEKKYPPDT